MVLTRNSGQSDENSRRLFRADVKFHAPILGSSQYTLDLLDQEGNCYSLTGYSPQVSYEIYPVGDFYESIGKMGITAQCEAEVTAVIAAYCKKRDL